MSVPQAPLQPYTRPHGHTAVCAALVGLWDALVAMTPADAERALSDRVVAAFLPGLDVPRVLAYLDHDRTRRAARGGGAFL